MKAIVLRAHKSNYPNPIVFSKGDILQLGKLDTEYAGWIRTQTQCGNEGWAPLDYIDVLSCSRKGVARCNYNASELDTDLGEELKVLEELNGWLLAENEHGQKGWVPKETLENVQKTL